MITIDGKNYDEKKFGVNLANYITARNELQVNKARIVMELEKVDVLTAHYDNQIRKLLEKETPIEKPDGKDS